MIKMFLINTVSSIYHIDVYDDWSVIRRARTRDRRRKKRGDRQGPGGIDHRERRRRRIH